MDPDKQDALSSIENSIYRTAFKLRSVQTLCQLDLIDISLTQHLLLHQYFWDARESSLSVQQLFQALQELFQRVRVEKPGQVHPRAPELTLSLLTAMYDSTGTVVLNLVPAAAALIALSGDSPLTKYRALFQLYEENNKGQYESGACMTRRTLRNLLTDLQQIPAVVGESHALCSVESATRSCFQGVLSPAIKEEKFLSWLRSEPPILLWLPTCYRSSVTEMVTHPARCSICRNFPITGLRYRCLKCFNFDICQVCFLSGLHSKSHQKSHPVIEHCVPMSAKENTKLLLRTLRNNLLQGRCRRKEAERRQWLLDQVNPKVLANPAHTRLLEKQLNRCKDRLQALCASQEEKNSRFETKIRQLTTNQDSLWTKLQQMGEDLQATLQPLDPLSSSCPNMVSKSDLSLTKRFWRKGDSSWIKNITEEGSEWEPLPNSTAVGRSHPSQTNTEHALPNPEPPEAILQPRSVRSSRAQNQAQKMMKQSLPSAQEGLLLDIPQFIPAEISSPALAPAERKETTNIEERKDELEEEELQELLSKCMDAFTLEMPSGPQSSVNTDLYHGAEQVSRAFSALIDQITLPNLK
ncbi:dystrotelin [Elephas maximus indicus]|uniref:dystrotelin n=1 Tax=Elephas maximus indicus TaxID=99487 RepID=UPI0021166983|nr:dystrotelin [Elephas maximus indicus]